MDSYQCFVNLDWSCIADWTAGQMFSFLVFSVLILGVIRGVYKIIVGLFIARSLLIKNRGKLGKGFGTRAADAFVAVWYTDKSVADTYQESLGNSSTRLPLDIIAREHLIDRKLVEIYEHTRNKRKFVRPIKNFRNWIVLRALIFDLVHKYDDDPKVYKDLKKQSRKR